MRTRTNSADEFVGFGGCKNKENVGWWLFHNFEQCVCGARSELVRLINNVNLVTRGDRSENRLVAQIASVINESMSRGIKFDNVD